MTNETGKLIPTITTTVPPPQSANGKTVEHMQRDVENRLRRQNEDRQKRNKPPG